MAEGKHTPGSFVPFVLMNEVELVLGPGNSGHIIRDADGRDIAATFGVSAESNARLYAEAHAMKESLGALCDRIRLALREDRFINLSSAEAQREHDDARAILARIKGVARG